MLAGLLVLLLLLSCGGESNSTEQISLNERIKQQMNQVLDNYMQLKDQLIAGNIGEAVKKSKALYESVLSVDARQLPEDQRQQWEKHKNVIKGGALLLMNKDKLHGQRTAFWPLSNEMIAFAKTFKPADGELYVQHCPMAFNKAGADWLSATKAIENPYYGKKMLNCGNTKEAIH